MIITTARKPSPKTRTFCRHLGRFTGIEYVSRGKTGLSAFEDTPFLLVGEYKGNPANLSFFLKGRCVLAIRASVSLVKNIEPGKKPVIQGSTPLAFALSKIAGFMMEGSSERVIHVNENIEFIDKGVPYIVLKVLAVRSEEIV